jgi:hypothetical protein
MIHSHFALFCTKVDQKNIFVSVKGYDILTMNVIFRGESHLHKVLALFTELQ